MSGNEMGCQANNPWHDEENSRQMYHGERLSTHEIAERLGTSGSVIYNWLQKHDIATRDQSTAQTKEVIKSDILERLYHEERMSTRAIANRLDVSNSHVLRSMKSHGIPRRDNNHAIRGSGEDNPNWKGGHDYYYGEQWQDIRERVLNRDGHQCRSCGITNEKHKDERGEELHVHHVIPVVKFNDPSEANSMGNLVSACRECHNRFEGLPVFPK